MRIGGALLLAAMLGMMVSSSMEMSMTVDEGNHLVRGLTPLSGGGFVLNRDHPPLANLLQGLPVHLALSPTLPANPPSKGKLFRYSHETLWRSGNDGVRMILLGRYATMAMTLLLGLLLWRWSVRFHGEVGGLLSLALFALSSICLSHGSLITTDMAHALGVFVAAYTLWRFGRAPSLSNTVWCGVGLLVAMGSKHISLLLVPLSLGYLFAIRWRCDVDLNGALGRRGGRFLEKRAGWVQALVIWTAMMVIVGVGIWALFGFSVGTSRALGIPVPAPVYVDSLFNLAEGAKTGRTFYLNGEASSSGWWYYFPAAILYKTALPALLLIGGAVVLRFKKGFKGVGPTGLIAAIVCVYVLAIGASGMNLGLRYVLPLYPFLFLLAGGIVSVRRRWMKGVVAALAAWLVAGTAAAHPYHLSRFNELIPKARRHHYLADSNLDWGQDLPAFARYQKENGLGTILLAYFGFADPAAYGVDARRLSSFGASRGEKMYLFQPDKFRRKERVAVSANHLQGLFLRDSNAYEQLRKTTPTAILGGSILLFEVGPGE